MSKNLTPIPSTARPSSNSSRSKLNRRLNPPLYIPSLPPPKTQKPSKKTMPSPPLSLSSPSTLPSSRDPTEEKPWRPYTSSGDFDANVAMILIILVCALVCALAINTAIRCFIRRRPRPSDGPSPGKLTHNAPAAVKLPPPLVFSAGMKLAGAEAECAICLSEFVNGEGVRVLPRCKHGFHVKCIEEWLVSRSSCPTCRASYLTNSPWNGGSTAETVAEP